MSYDHEVGEWWEASVALSACGWCAFGWKWRWSALVQRKIASDLTIKVDSPHAQGSGDVMFYLKKAMTFAWRNFGAAQWHLYSQAHQHVEDFWQKKERSWTSCSFGNLQLRISRARCSYRWRSIAVSFSIGFDPLHLPWQARYLVCNKGSGNMDVLPMRESEGSSQTPSAVSCWNSMLVYCWEGVKHMKMCSIDGLKQVSGPMWQENSEKIGQCSMWIFLRFVTRWWWFYQKVNKLMCHVCEWCVNFRFQ